MVGANRSGRPLAFLDRLLSSPPATDPMLLPAVSIAPDAGHSVISSLRRSGLFSDYQRAFESLTGLPLMLREAGSFRPPLQGSSRVNPFCSLMTKGNTTCAACLQLQQRLEDDARLEPKTLRCYAGLSESAVPVRLGDQVLGYLQTGQVFLRAPSMKRFQNAVRLSGGGQSPAELRRMECAYFQTRVLTGRQYRSVLRLLVTFAEHLAIVSNQTLLMAAKVESPVITSARRFIAAHQTEKMCLGDVARAVNMSVFHFCKFFHRSTGLGFLEFVARARVESAKPMLLSAHTRISEAAFAAGFQSLSQFNRVFHRIVGETPTCYRGRLHGWRGRSNGNGTFVRVA